MYIHCENNEIEVSLLLTLICVKLSQNKDIITKNNTIENYTIL